MDTPKAQNTDQENPSLVSRLKSALFPSRRKRNGEISLRDTLEELAEETADTIAVSAHERTLLENIVHLRDVTAYDVRVPRADIVSVPRDIALPDLIGLILDKTHSRLPVYGDSVDDVVGMVHIKDVLAWTDESKSNDPFELEKILRKVLFVSPAMRALDLLLEMRVSRLHMALVVDEYGGIDGLVTIEDLVEEIVGEIEDEHDVVQSPELRQLSDGSFVADARVRLEDFVETADLPASFLEQTEVDVHTLGGLVFLLAGRVPDRGELIVYAQAGLQFEILDVEPRRIQRLQVRRLRQSPTPDWPAAPTSPFSPAKDADNG